MNIDWTINIGSVVGGVVSGGMFLIGFLLAAQRFWHGVDRRIASAENALRDHSHTLVAHASRMQDHESRMITVIQDVARIIGQMGNRRHEDWDGIDRRRK